MAKGKYQKWLEEDNLIVLEGWARTGLTDEQIAHNMGITVKTLYEWKNRFALIRDAIKKGKEVVDFEVENALFKKAIGFKQTVRKAIKVKKPFYDTEGRRIDNEEVVLAEEDIYIPPDTTAQIFWLKNRKPEFWMDKPKPIVAEEKEDSGLIDALRAPMDEADLEDDIGLLDD